MNMNRRLALVVALAAAVAGSGFGLGFDRALWAQTEEPDPEAEFYACIHEQNFPKAQQLLTAYLTAGKLEKIVLANMLLALGNQLIQGGKASEALPWLETLEKDFGDLPTDDEGHGVFKALTAPKISWIKAGAKRPWAEKNPEALADKVAQALSTMDMARLEQLLAATDTYVGWWESEFDIIPRDMVLEHLKKYAGEKIIWVNRPEFSQATREKHEVLFANTHGWQDMEGFTNIQFALHETSDGWEWRGIVLGESPSVSEELPKAD
jgi:hypothetical protein